jgi:hypothetical protein
MPLPCQLTEQEGLVRCYGKLGEQSLLLVTGHGNDQGGLLHILTAQVVAAMGTDIQALFCHRLHGER